MPTTKKQPPTARQVQEYRARAGLSAALCASLIYVSRRMWHKYESGEAKMHPAFIELFKLKTGQF
jgi:predicted transcriptional regulator